MEIQYHEHVDVFVSFFKIIHSFEEDWDSLYIKIKGCFIFNRYYIVLVKAESLKCSRVAA